MQSRLAATASSRLYRALFIGCNEQVLPHRFTAAASTSNRSKTADPAIHSGELEASPEIHRGEPQDTEKSGAAEADHGERGTGTDPLVQPKPQLTSSPRLESTEVNRPSGHNLQQKRTTGSSVAPLEEVSCVGLDGSPWPKDKKEEQKSEREQTLDDRDYYKHHKASPLSGIEVADTRKPITQATDGTAADPLVYGGGRDVMGWRPEQLDTAEEALRRAALIWKQNAMRGDPDSPHGRVLRELRGEWF
ncbi:hypothetical protein SLA2020_292930 [Shorea laevis]